MDTYRAKVISEWLLALRGKATQDAFLAELHSVVKWAPHRPNLSAYENAKAVPEEETLDKFIAYAASRGVDPPDFTPPQPVPPIEERMLAAALAQTAAITALVGELQKARTEDRDRIVDLEKTVARLARERVSVQGTGGRRAPHVPRETTE